MKLTKINKLLFEAYRRNDMADSFEKSKPLCQRWLGLGTEAAYRPIIKAGLMKFHTGKTPPLRCMDWLCLTDAGIREMQRLSQDFKSVLDTIKQGPYSHTYLANYQLAGGITRG